jgi:hypothetical protein
LFCPTCEPRKIEPDDISLTLVCSVTGKEKDLVRSKRRKLPNGKIPNRKFVVMTVAPEVWAKNRV